MLITKIFAVCFLLMISFLQCNQTNETASKEYLKGIWKGTLSGKTEMFTNFTNDNQVEMKSCVGEDDSLVKKDSDASSGRYKSYLYRENDKVVLKIEGDEELFYPVIDEKNGISFGLANSRKPIIPMIAVADFHRTDQMSCE